jgi:hypothetical protein
MNTAAETIKSRFKGEETTVEMSIYRVLAERAINMCPVT